MTLRRRVVVTGIGAITPIGLTRDGLWQGLRREQSAVGLVTRFDASQFRSQVAAEVCDFVASDHIEAKRAKRLDRFGQFSVIGANMGSALGGVAFAEEQSARFLAGGLRAVDPIVALAVYGGASSCNIAIEFGISGPNSTNAMSCASGTIAIGDAYRLIRDGYADAMLCGASETPLAPLCFGAFALIRAMSTRNDDPGHASRPFDKDRDGFVMGEAAVVLVLEEHTRAVARGAPMYAEVVGYGTTNDAYHMTAPLPSGTQAARSIRLALRDAELEPGEIGYVNAHGSSTPLNDPTETSAIKQVFGDRAYRVPVSGTKGYYGHALGASGAIEAAICSLSLRHEWLPPTINLEEPDQGCDLDYIPSVGRDLRVEYVLSNSFGFGGINASLVFKRVD
jgi:3-oxoacyl-[acyl-carrier-protein] synthase II